VSEPLTWTVGERVVLDKRTWFEPGASIAVVAKVGKLHVTLVGHDGWKFRVENGQAAGKCDARSPRIRKLRPGDEAAIALEAWRFSAVRAAQDVAKSSTKITTYNVDKLRQFCSLAAEITKPVEVVQLP
jgi:hypothetical protein